MKFSTFLIFSSVLGAFDEMVIPQPSNSQGKLEGKEKESPQTYEHPVEWRIDDGSKERMYTWSTSPDITKAAWNCIREADCWTTSQHVANQNKQASSRVFKIFDQIVRLCQSVAKFLLNVSRRAKEIIEHGDKLCEGTYGSPSSEKIHRPARKSIPFFILTLPHISLKGIRRDETHYVHATDSLSRANIDALIHQRVGKGVFWREKLNAIPTGFEINEEIIIYSLGDAVAENGLADMQDSDMNNIYMYNANPQSAIYSDQFDTFYGLDREEFHRKLTAFPANLLDGDLDNFLALPGTTVPIDRNLLLTAVNFIRENLADTAYIVYKNGRTTNDAISQLSHGFEQSACHSWMSYFSLGRPSSGSEKKRLSSEGRKSNRPELVHPLLERDVDGLPPGEQSWGLRKICNNVWIPLVEKSGESADSE